MLLTELARSEGRGFLSRLRDRTVERDLRKLVAVHGSLDAVHAEVRRRRKAGEPRLAMGVSYVTIVKAATHGEPIRDFAVAEKISLATEGRVSVAEICDPERFARRKRKVSTR